MGEKKYKRSQIVVDKEFQFRYLMTWVLLTMSLLAGLVVGSLTVLWYFHNSHIVLTYFIWVNALCAVVITGVSVYYIIIHSHRIAGPAYRLQRLMKDLAKGRRGFRVRLRKKDYLKHVADALNEVIEHIEQREALIRELAMQVGELSHNGHDIHRVHEVSGRVSAKLVELCPAVTEVAEDGALSPENA